MQVMSVWPFRSLILRSRRSTLPSDAPPGAAPTEYLFSFGDAESLCRDLGMTNRLSGCSPASSPGLILGSQSNPRKHTAASTRGQ